MKLLLPRGIVTALLRPGSVAALLLFGGLTAPALAHGDPMTLAECLRQALAHNPGLQAAAESAQVANAERDSVRGHLLPTVKAKGNLLGWNEAFTAHVDVAPFAALFKDFEPFLSDQSKQVLAEMQKNGLPFQVHDQFTYMASVTAAQPLTQLYQIIAGYKAHGQLAKAAAFDSLHARHQIELDVARTYYGLIAAMKMHETAQAGLEQVQAMEKQVGEYLKAGVVERNALLKVEVQKADIKRKLLQTSSAAELARAMLNASMGRPLTTSFEPVVNAAPLARASGQLADQQGEALRARPELAAARLRRDAASLARHAAIGDMLPPITALFSYEFNHGFPMLMPQQQFFYGVLLDWNLWEWGAGYYKVKAAEAKARAATHEVRAAEDKIRLDVEARRLAVDEASQSLELARTQREQASENLRVEKLRFDVQETTVTDLLAAHTLALQAENEAIIATVKLSEALLALHSATGGDLLDVVAQGSADK